VAVITLLIAYKHSGMREGGAKPWVASASALLMNPGDAVSSDGTALQGAQPPEQRAAAAFPGPRCHGGVIARFYPRRGAVGSRGVGSAQALGKYLVCAVLCNVTQKLVQFLSMFPVN